MSDQEVSIAHTLNGEGRGMCRATILQDTIQSVTRLLGKVVNAIFTFRSALIYRIYWLLLRWFQQIDSFNYSMIRTWRKWNHGIEGVSTFGSVDFLTWNLFIHMSLLLPILDFHSELHSNLAFFPEYCEKISWSLPHVFIHDHLLPFSPSKGGSIIYTLFYFISDCVQFEIAKRSIDWRLNSKLP